VNEFDLIRRFFANISYGDKRVVVGIGDDGACMDIPDGKQLVVSCDTLVSGVHFRADWSPYDIASRVIRVNVSDMAAMGATPAWITLALTLPSNDVPWLTSFSRGICDTMARYNLALVGGDTTRGPLTITATVHGLVEKNKALRRDGAKSGDKIYVTGKLGGAGLAVAFLDKKLPNPQHKRILMDALLHPEPRVDLSVYLQRYATAAIDISDGLSGDLNHILVASGVGACIEQQSIPVHPLVETYQTSQAVDFTLSAGDDYALCFTVSPHNEQALLAALAKAQKRVYCIGSIEKQGGLRMQYTNGEIRALKPQGYSHF